VFLNVIHLYLLLFLKESSQFSVNEEEYTSTETMLYKNPKSIKNMCPQGYGLCDLLNTCPTVIQQEMQLCPPKTRYCPNTDECLPICPLNTAVINSKVC